MKDLKILVINPGSTSSKVDLFKNSECKFSIHVFHDAPELLKYKTINDQLDFRKKVIMDFIEKNNIDMSDLDAIVGRGGSSYTVESGIYEINDLLIEDTRACKSGIDHPSNLGVQLARELQKEYGGRIFMVDPVCVDELTMNARMTGIKGVYRKVASHALNLKGTARYHCENVLHRRYEDTNLIVCHIDGGISVSAHEKGRQIDCNDAAGGDGPYTPTRIGSISVRDILEYAEGKDLKEVRKLCSRSGGFVSHFGTSNSDTIHRMIDEGNQYAKDVWDGMIYNIYKYIGAMATVLGGKVDSIVLTGGLMRFKEIEDKIKEKCEWIAPVYSYVGEVENRVMADSACKVLRGEVIPKIYSGKHVWEPKEDY